MGLADLPARSLLLCLGVSDSAGTYDRGRGCWSMMHAWEKIMPYLKATHLSEAVSGTDSDCPDVYLPRSPDRGLTPDRRLCLCLRQFASYSRLAAVTSVSQGVSNDGVSGLMPSGKDVPFLTGLSSEWRDCRDNALFKTFFVRLEPLPGRS